MTVVGLGWLLVGGCASTGWPGAEEGGSAEAQGAEGTREVALFGTPVGPELGGSRWTWVSAACTEGELALELRDGSLEVEADDEGLLLTFDQGLQVSDARCRRTVVLRARATGRDGLRRLVEESRVALPAHDSCVGRIAPERVGEVLRRGERLQLMIRHSGAYCGGLEARFEFVPAVDQPSGEALARAFFAHFARRDQRAASALFAPDGVLVNTFETEDASTGQRHEGRARVAAFLRGVFAQPAWLSVRLRELATGDDGRTRVVFEYMDERREAPLRAEAWLTTAAGEVLELRVAPARDEALLGVPPAGDMQAADRPGDGAASAANQGGTQ